MRTAVLLGWMVIWASSPASAATPRERATALIYEAERLYAEGEYRKAADLLAQAQAIEPHPRILYNLARAYDQAGDVQAALENYQRYVASAEDDNPTLKKRAQLAVERLQGLLNRETQSRLAREQATRESQEVRASAQAELEAARRERARALNRELAREQQDLDVRRGVAYGLGGLAVASLGAGVVLGLSANTAKARFTVAGTPEEKRSWQGTTQQRALFADIGFSVSLAAAVTAVLLFPKGTDVPSVSVSWRPGLTFVTTEGRF